MTAVCICIHNMISFLPLKSSGNYWEHMSPSRVTGRVACQQWKQISHRLQGQAEGARTLSLWWWMSCSPVSIDGGYGKAALWKLFLQQTFFVDFKIVFLNSFICVHISVCTCTCVWRSGKDLRESVVSFHRVGSGDQTWVIRFGHQASLTTEPSLQPYSFFNWQIIWYIYLRCNMIFEIDIG